LIQLGVRCVIVAGWEVDDDCAKAFGLRFYSEMLDGASFGEATLEARRAAYETKSDNNTWGAFQCYGDPDYRARVVTATPGAADDGDRFVGVSEAIVAAEQISGDLNVGLERDPTVQRDRLVRIESEAKLKGWLKSATLCAALAEARAELGDLVEAIDYYSAAIRSEKAGFKLRVVEQLANLRSRSAVSKFRNGPAEGRSPETAVEEIQASLRALESLTQAVGPTPERLSLQGGCWKRLAQVQPSDLAANDALKRMSLCCVEALELGGEDPDYPRFMACNAAICMAVRDGTDCDPAVGKDLQRMIEQPAPQEADFWKLIRSADARTNVAILRGAPPEEMDKLKHAYRRAWRHVGSPVKMRSVIEQLEFFADIFSGGAPQTAETRKRIVAWVAELRHFIETEFLAE
jgi:CHAT domain